MRILDETLNYFANQMIDDFKKSDIYKKLCAEAAQLNCKIKADCGKSVNIKDHNIYIGIVFCDEYDKCISF